MSRSRKGGTKVNNNVSALSSSDKTSADIPEGQVGIRAEVVREELTLNF